MWFLEQLLLLPWQGCLCPSFSFGPGIEALFSWTQKPHCGISLSCVSLADRRGIGESGLVEHGSPPMRFFCFELGRGWLAHMRRYGLEVLALHYYAYAIDTLGWEWIWAPFFPLRGCSVILQVPTERLHSSSKQSSSLFQVTEQREDILINTDLRQ